MSGFDPITVIYDGAEKKIPADNFLIILAEIEEIITFDQLNDFLVSAQKGGKKTKIALIAQGYLKLLQLSGFDAPHPVEISKKIMSGSLMGDAVTSLTNLFGQLMNDEDKGEQPEKKQEQEAQQS